jgi:hypothetical protein
MSDYDAVMQKLENDIFRYAGLAQAQQPDSAFAAHYQQRVHTLTAALRTVEQAAPSLAQLDRKIAAAEADLDKAYNCADQRPLVWPQLGTWTGALGAIGVLAGAGLGLPWQVVVFSVVLLLAAAGCVVMTVRQRRTASADLLHAQEVLAALEERRRSAAPNLAELTGGAA